MKDGGEGHDALAATGGQGSVSVPRAATNLAAWPSLASKDQNSIIASW
jgi:hypothetical protein